MPLSPRARASLQALLVTFLWATSWVFIKIGLQDIPPLTFAGLRYTLALLCLLPFAMRRQHLAALRNLTRSAWLMLAALGVVFYTLTQGAQFVSLKYLPAVTVNLLLNFTPVIVALLGIAVLAERPTRLQWAGMAVALVGALVFFMSTPGASPSGQAIGYAAAAIGLVANAVAAVLGRAVNRQVAAMPSGAAADAQPGLSPLLVTVISMGVGAPLLLGAGLATTGLPRLTPEQWAMVAWLAVVNTAFAFTLWNRTLRTLSAIESSIIANLLIIQIPVLAWVFLGEALTATRIVGLALAGMGTLVVQLRRLPRGRA